MKHLVTIAIAAALALPALAQSGSEGLQLTVYNQGLGLVRDLRTLDLRKGVQEIRFADVASQIDPTSVHFVAPGNPDGVTLLEQNYQFDLVDRARLLEKYLGQEITLATYDESGTLVRRETGTLLSAEGGSVGAVRIGDRIVLNPPGVIELPELPAGLIVKPTLVWSLASDVSGRTPCEVSYMTGGIGWSADYVLSVNEDDTKADLNGWVTITNGSGATYPSAKLKLIAGDVARVPEPNDMEEMSMLADGVAEYRKAGFEEKAFFEYHMYTLGRPTTVADRETKQVLFHTAPGVDVSKLYIFEPSMAWRYGGQEPQKKVAVKLELVNSEAQGLGLALPMGKVRVYKADDDGSLQFVGEDQIDHTPKDEKVRLYIGNAFDLVGEEIQMDHKQVTERLAQDTFTVKLRNRKDNETVKVTYVTHPGGEWEILRSSDPFVKKNATTTECTVTLEPGQEKEITYTLQTKW